jgi:hypothetical protein
MTEIIQGEAVMFWKVTFHCMWNTIRHLKEDHRMWSVVGAGWERAYYCECGYGKVKP